MKNKKPAVMKETRGRKKKGNVRMIITVDRETKEEAQKKHTRDGVNDKLRETLENLSK